MPADRLGLTLMHEHVLVDFIGADQVSPSRYDANHVFTTVLPHLQQARALGCETLVECTPAYLGRDPRLLRRLSEASGIHILSNTGYYGAAKDKHLPPHAFTETADQLAARWIREVERGIEGTSVKPAFMKIGVDEGPLSEVDSKLVRAAALTHRETGLPIASHTTHGRRRHGGARSARPCRRAALRVHLGACTQRARRDLSHASGETWRMGGVRRHLGNDRGAARRARGRMKAQGLLGHVLVSHDAGWYRVGEAGGGQFRPYDTLFTAFVPALRSAGFSDGDIRQLLVTNPHTALARR